MDLNQKITYSDTVFAQKVDEEMVLLDMSSENYFGLDEVGTAIWDAMQEVDTLQGVYDSMLAQYDVEPEVLKKDLIIFVEKLTESGLVSLST